MQRMEISMRSASATFMNIVINEIFSKGTFLIDYLDSIFHKLSMHTRSDSIEKQSIAINTPVQTINLQHHAIELHTFSKSKSSMYLLMVSRKSPLFSSSLDFLSLFLTGSCVSVSSWVIFFFWVQFEQGRTLPSETFWYLVTTPNIYPQYWPLIIV